MCVPHFLFMFSIVSPLSVCFFNLGFFCAICFHFILFFHTYCSILLCIAVYYVFIFLFSCLFIFLPLVFHLFCIHFEFAISDFLSLFFD